MQKKCLKTKPAKPNVPQAKLGLPISGVQSLLLEHRSDPILDSDFHANMLYTAQIYLEFWK